MKLRKELQITLYWISFALQLKFLLLLATDYNTVVYLTCKAAICNCIDNWSDTGESAVTSSSITCKWMSCIISTRIFINPLSKKKSLQIDKIRLNKTPDKWKLSPSGSWHWLNSEAYIGYLTLFFSVNEKTITSTKTTGCDENNFHLEMFIKDNHLRLNPINVDSHWHIKLALYTGFINSHKTYHPRHNKTMNFWSLPKKAFVATVYIESQVLHHS